MIILNLAVLVFVILMQDTRQGGHSTWNSEKSVKSQGI